MVHNAFVVFSRHSLCNYTYIASIFSRSPVPVFLGALVLNNLFFRRARMGDARSQGSLFPIGMVEWAYAKLWPKKYTHHRCRLSEKEVVRLHRTITNYFCLLTYNTSSFYGMMWTPSTYNGLPLILNKQ